MALKLVLYQEISATQLDTSLHMLNPCKWPSIYRSCSMDFYHSP